MLPFEANILRTEHDHFATSLNQEEILLFNPKKRHFVNLANLDPITSSRLISEIQILP